MLRIERAVVGDTGVEVCALAESVAAAIRPAPQSAPNYGPCQAGGELSKILPYFPERCRAAAADQPVASRHGRRTLNGSTGLACGLLAALYHCAPIAETTTFASSDRPRQTAMTRLACAKNSAGVGWLRAACPSCTRSSSLVGSPAAASSCTSFTVHLMQQRGDAMRPNRCRRRNGIGHPHIKSMLNRRSAV